MAERARLGLSTRPEGGYQGGGGDVIRADLCWLLGFCRDLNPTEEKVARAYYGSAAGIVGYEAVRRIADMIEGDGEDIVDVRPKDLDGNQLGGEWVKVKGVKARMPTYDEAAAALAAEGMRNADNQPMSGGAVKKVLSAVSEKVWGAIRARQAMAQWEARACG